LGSLQVRVARYGARDNKCPSSLIWTNKLPSKEITSPMPKVTLVAAEMGEEEKKPKRLITSNPENITMKK
jgi:hypothetical protein